MNFPDGYQNHIDCWSARETDESFAKLYNFVCEVKFDRKGVLRHPQEEHRRITRMDEQVIEDVKEDRYHRLMALQQSTRQDRM